MKSYNEWLPEARVAIPGADDTLIKQQIAAVVREFFTRATWVEDLFPITLKEDRDRYSFGVLCSYYSVYLQSAMIDDTPIAIYAGKPSAYSSTPGVWIDAQNDQVVVVPIPSATTEGSKLKLHANIKPQKNCTQVPDRLFETFFDEILDGVKGRMYSMPSKPWTDRALGALHMKRFSAGIARARVAGRTGYSSADTTWSYPSWA